MAQKRMFSLSIVDTDRFLDMPTSTQALYFHLGLHGDDDGFVSSPRKITRSVGCGDDDLRVLASRGYIIPFDSGVVVITDWNLHNTLKNDRYRETIYQSEKAELTIDEAGRYTLGTNSVPERFQPGSSLEPTRFQSGSRAEPQHNITEQNPTEHRKRADKPPTRPQFSTPSVDEVRQYCLERGNDIDPVHFVDYYEANGWVQGKGNPIRDWKAVVRTWENRSRQCVSGHTKAGRQAVKRSEDYEGGDSFV